MIRIGILVLFLFSCSTVSAQQMHYAGDQTDEFKEQVREMVYVANKLQGSDMQLAIDYIDSVAPLVLENEEYCNYAVLNIIKSTGYIFAGQYEIADSILKEAEGLAPKCPKDGYVMYGVYNNLHFIASDLGSNDKSDSLLQLSIDQAVKLDDKKKIAYGHANKGVNLGMRGKQSESLVEYFKALEVGTDLKDTTFLTGIYSSLAGAYLSLKSYHKTIDYCKKAIAFEQLVPAYYISIAYNNMGAAYVHLDSLEEAVTAYNYNVDLCEKNQLLQSLSYALHGIGEVYLKQEKLAKAKEYFEKAYDIETKINLRNDQVNSLRSLGRLEFMADNLSEALSYTNRGIEMAEELGVLDELHELKNQRIEIKLALLDGDLLLDYQEMEKVKDSLFVQSRIQLGDELESKYSVKQKDIDNQKLKAEQKLKAATISNQNRLLALGGIGLGLISLFTFFLYRQKEQQRTLNKELTKSRDHIQTLNQEINHRVKNNLTFMTSLLEMQVRRTDLPEAKEILRESEARLKALSLVHSNLNIKEQSAIDLGVYLRDIIQHLETVFQLPNKRLTIKPDFISYSMGAEEAMRIGLVVNELVTNSLKHVDKEDVYIEVKTYQADSGKLKLSYIDNGEGIERHLDTVEDNDSMGLQLIKLLRKQLKGHIDILLV